MDAATALADLLELSSQVRAAAVAGGDWAVEAANDDAAGERLVTAAREVWAAAGEVQPERTLNQLEVALAEGSLFVVSNGERSVVATTAPQPSSGLVLYDLRTCLRSLDEQPKKRGRKQAAADA